jgi:transcriptional regulator EpsA
MGLDARLIMQGMCSELMPQEQRPAVEPLELPAEPEQSPASSAVLDALQLESLLLNLDAALRVHARSHFFSWTQGLLQSLIRHEVLICVLRSGAPPSFRVDSFSTIVPDPAIFSELLLGDAPAAMGLVKAWKERRFNPVIGDVGEGGTLLNDKLERAFARVGITQTVAHGCFGVDGEAASLFIFASRSSVQDAAAKERQAYVARLIVPFVHAAWVRSQIQDTTARDHLPPTEVGVLTPREQEILRWIYLGKSNGEVGTILKISPLTVKNHVQKILRKLNVVNRTQAVGKALDTRILNP